MKDEFCVCIGDLDTFLDSVAELPSYFKRPSRISIFDFFSLRCIGGLYNLDVHETPSVRVVSKSNPKSGDTLPNWCIIKGWEPNEIN